jgi:MFS transporter, PPP family, 3-phenylpropionic acid transporter
LVDVTAGGKVNFFSIGASYFFVLLTFGIFVPFFPLWLSSQGFTEREIGFLLAMPLVMRLVATTPLTFFGESLFGTKQTYILCSALIALGFSGLLLFDGSHVVAASLLVVSIFWAPVIPLLDTIAVRATSNQGFDYGQLRQWGSISYFLGTVAVGSALTVVSISVLPILLTVCAILAVVFGTQIVDAKVRNKEGAELALNPKLGSKQLYLVIVGVSLLQASHAYLSAFSSLSWQQMGFSSLQVGVFWACGVLSESVFFLLSGKYVKSYDPLLLVTVGGAIGCLRWCLMAFDPASSLIIVPLQLLHCCSFGAVHLGTMQWLSKYGRNSATLQGTTWALIGGATAMVTVMSGYLYGPSGTAGYMAMSLVALVGLCFVAIARKRSSGRIPADFSVQDLK